MSIKNEAPAVPFAADPPWPQRRKVIHSYFPFHFNAVDPPSAPPTRGGTALASPRSAPKGCGRRMSGEDMREDRRIVALHARSGGHPHPGNGVRTS